MQEPRKLKDIFAALAATFGVPKGRIWDTVKRCVKGFGRGWQSRSYVERPIDPDEAKEFNLPDTSVVLSLASDKRPCLVIHPSAYKDKDQVERTTVNAASFDYLRSVSMKKIQPSDWEPDDDIQEPDGDSEGP